MRQRTDGVAARVDVDDRGVRGKKNLRNRKRGGGRDGGNEGEGKEFGNKWVARASYRKRLDAKT